MTFDQAYRAYRPRLAHYAQRRCVHASIEAEDLLQETFVQAWRIWAKRSTSNILAWLVGVLRRVAAHMVRRGMTEKRGRGWVTPAVWKADEDHRAVAPTQELSVMVSQMRGHIATLGPAQRAAVTGAMDGFTLTEIAKQQGVSIQAVSGSLKLARQRLNQFA